MSMRRTAMDCEDNRPSRQRGRKLAQAEEDNAAAAAHRSLPQVEVLSAGADAAAAHPDVRPRGARNAGRGRARLPDSDDGNREGTAPPERAQKRARVKKAVNVESGGQCQPTVGTDLKKKRALRKRGGNDPAASLVDDTSMLPPYFAELERCFQAVNIVCALLGARRGITVTLSKLQESVLASTGRQLLLEDVAAFRAVCPELLALRYLGEGEHFTPSCTAYLAEGIVKSERMYDHYKTLFAKILPSAAPRARELVIEFLDKMPRAPSSKSFSAFTLSAAPVSTKSIQLLIERRNKFFHESLVLFYTQNARADNTSDKCEEGDGEFKGTTSAEESLSARAVEALKAAARACIPEQPTAVEAVEPPLPGSVANAVTNFLQELDSPAGRRECHVVEGGRRLFPARSAEFSEPTKRLTSEMSNVLLSARGIRQLYKHQCQALNWFDNGYNVVVSTHTSSGKSIIYQLPVLCSLEKDISTRALFIFPTKALAQDQKRSFCELVRAHSTISRAFTDSAGVERVDAIVGTYDGDTPANKRKVFREVARVILTNPDMLHTSILPHHVAWKEFLRNLKFVVVDELHYYSGQFGGHVALIMRRLRRLCAVLYGNRDVQFVSCSATLGNPLEHMQVIFGIPDSRIRLVDVDTAPSGKKEILIWNPPLINPEVPADGRRSAVTEASQLLIRLIKDGARLLAFCKTRKSCEALMKQIRDDLHRLGDHDLIRRVMTYRGGYLPEDRRQIEAKLFRGELLAVAATNALELGVDIGSLDAVIMMGFPWTLSAMWQQSGRAGRRQTDSMSIIIADSHPLDQHYARHPSEVFDDKPPSLRVDPWQPAILEAHLHCAAAEASIDPSKDAEFFSPVHNGDSANVLASFLDGKLVQDTIGHRYICGPHYQPHPPAHVNIRSIGGEDMFLVVNVTHGRNEVLEEMEADRAIFTIYEGAIYINQGYTYIVRHLNVDQKYAFVESIVVDWTTMQRDYKDVDPVKSVKAIPISGTTHSVEFGDVQVSKTVFGYFRVSKTKQILEAVDVDLPPIVRRARGIWIDVPKHVVQQIETAGWGAEASVHGLSHLFIALVPRFVACESSDILTECKSPLATRFRPARIIMYDARGMTASAVAQCFPQMSKLMLQAFEVISNCLCDDGCPECIHSSTCTEHNDLVSKKGSLAVLRALLSIPAEENTCDPCEDDEHVWNKVHQIDAP